MPFRGRRGRGLGHSPSALPPPLRLSAVCIEEAVDCVADKCGGEVLLAKMIQQETARAAPGSNPGPAGTHRVGRGALLALCCLTLCSRGLSSSGAPEQEFCSQILNSSVKPGFPKAIETNDPGVRRAARHSAEKFNNCSNDVFLFRESRISRALVQIVNGLRYVLSLEIGRTTCKKTKHPRLDSCDFQTNHTLQRTLSCYSEVWVVPWLQKCEVPVLLCH
ncbi:cystatin-F [Manis javanica]|uniref:cystatin-F n=1 Tax=Manis javanica TaxID=9974 RepID=UPI003C6D1D1A